MKMLKTISAASLLAVGINGLASAANPIQYVHISGAPAYRQDTIAAINYFVAHPPSGSGSGGETDAYNSVTIPSSGAVDPANSPYEQWYIPNYAGSGSDLVISLALTGSAAGVESVAAGAQQNVQGTSTVTLEQNFIPDAKSTSSLIGSPNNTGSNAFKNTEPHVPDFNLGDTFQPTTPYNGSVQLTQGSSGQYSTTWTFNPLTSSNLAIEPYVFLGSPGLASRGVTNISTAQAQHLYQYGRVPLSFFTGKTADRSAFVYGLSRDPGSGSRLITLAETGVGVTTPIITYQPTITGGAADAAVGDNVGGTFTTPISKYAAGLIASTQVYDGSAGDTGYAKFGTADQTGEILALTSSQSGQSAATQTAFFIAYLNPTDAAEASQYGGASVLTYNGVAYASGTPGSASSSTLTSLVTAQDALNLSEGKYTFWSYEQAQYDPTAISSLAQGVYNSLVADWPSVTLSTGMQLSTVPVSRLVDGGVVTGP